MLYSIVIEVDNVKIYRDFVKKGDYSLDFYLILSLLSTGESMMQKDELEQQLRSLADTYKYKRKQYKQLQEDLHNMEDAYNSLNKDERTYEAYIAEKTNKVIQTQKDIDQLKEKMERAVKALILRSRELRRAKNSDGPTQEERDFKLRELKEFNNKKVKELVEISMQYSTLQQTLSLLFNQVCV